MMRLFPLALAVLLLSACSRPTPDMETLSERFAPITDSYRQMQCEASKSSSTDPAVRHRDCRPKPPVNPNLRKTALYCYRTWAQPDCYETPQPNAETRLIGVLLPAAAAIQPVYSMPEADQVIKHDIEVRDLGSTSPSGPHPYFRNQAAPSGPRVLLPGR
jgi:hypothetical protein